MNKFQLRFPKVITCKIGKIGKSPGMCIPNSSVGGTVGTRFGLFKLDDAPLEGECVSTSVNPSVDELMKVYAAKRRKDNAGKAVEVSDHWKKKMQKLKITKNQKER